ncbi:unnamed protein product [Cunninghamella blakesleeana]
MSYNNNHHHAKAFTTNSNVNKENRRKTLPLVSFDAYPSSATVSINYLPQSRSSYPSAQQINYTTPLIYFLDHPYYFNPSTTSPPSPPLDQSEILDFDKVISSQGNKTGLEM